MAAKRGVRKSNDTANIMSSLEKHYHGSCSRTNVLSDDYNVFILLPSLYIGIRCVFSNVHCTRKAVQFFIFKRPSVRLDFSATKFYALDTTITKWGNLKRARNVFIDELAVVGW